MPLNLEMKPAGSQNIVLKNLDDLVLSAANSKHYPQGNFSLAEYLIEEAVKENAYVNGWYTAKPVSY